MRQLYEEIPVTDESSLPKEAGEYLIKIKHSGVHLMHKYSGSDLAKEAFKSIESYYLPLLPEADGRMSAREQDLNTFREGYKFCRTSKVEYDEAAELYMLKGFEEFIAGRLKQTEG